MANATSTQLQELYVAYFGRAADPTGLDYWTAKGTTTAAFAAHMHAQNEFKDVYGSLSTESQVNQIYKNLFDRTADTAGLTYWTKEINLGNLELAEIATHLIWAAQNNSGSEDDKTALTNKTNAAVAYTAEVELTASGILAYQAQSTDPWVAGDNITEAKSYMSGIDKSTTYTAAGVTTSVAVITGNGVPAEKKTFTLTTTVDTFTGGDSGDTFTADNTGTSATSSTADTLKGGDGTDTLNLFTAGTAATAAIPQLTSVEKINIYDMDVAFDASGVTGLTGLNVYRGEGDSTFTVASGVDVSLNELVVGTGTGATDTTIAYSATQTSANLSLAAVTMKGTSTDEDVTITGAKITTVDVTTSGAKSAFDGLHLAAATTVNLAAGAAFEVVATGLNTTGTSATLNITGTGAVKLGTLDTGFTTVDASGSSGGVTAAVGAGTAVVLTGSTGNDVITASTEDTLTTSHDLAVDAGAGIDTLVIADASDINTAADAARYTNFEKVKVGLTQNLKLLSDDITDVEIIAGSSKSYTGLSVTQAKNITFSGNQGTAVTLAGRATGGTADVLTVDLANTTATREVTVAGAVVSGYETVNLNASTGTDAGTDSSFVFATAANTSAINLTGTHDITVAINSSKSTGVTFTSTSTGEVTVSGDVAKDSTITTGSNNDALTLSTTLGSTYSSGAGNDTFSTAIASLVADGVDDHSVNGGAGVDTISVADSSDTVLTDNHFTNVSNMEKLTILEDAGTMSVTLGGAATSAFPNGITLTATALAHHATAVNTWAGGLYQKDQTLTITTSQIGSTTTEDITLTTGAGNDSITLATSAWVGSAGATASIAITTRAGDDTITLSGADLAANTTNQAITITPGTGADTLSFGTAGTRNGAGSKAYALITIADGDSLAATRDKITGFEVGDNTNYADILDFGVATVSNFTASTDSGVILSHALTTGVAVFDDAAAYAAELIINSTNLDDVLSYLETNTDAGDNVAFEYDSVGDGANDATIVFNNGTLNSVVELVGLTGATRLGTTAKTTNMIGLG